MADTLDTARSRVERELKERLARTGGSATALGVGAAPVSPSAAQPSMPPVTASIGSAPIATIALRCVECNAIVDSDARFCTTCGVRFNAQIVVRELVGGKSPERVS